MKDLEEIEYELIIELHHFFTADYDMLVDVHKVLKAIHEKKFHENIGFDEKYEYCIRYHLDKLGIIGYGVSIGTAWIADEEFFEKLDNFIRDKSDQNIK